MRRRYKLIFRALITGLSLLILLPNDIYSQPLDSLPPLTPWNKLQLKINKATSSKAYQMTYISVPLIAAGLIIKGESHHFQALRNDYIPSFRHHYDDYLQYSPAIVMLGLKAAGVQGRSSWGRMAVSDAFSVGLMAVTVNLLKSTSDVKRPDGSGHNSFPSGHTATAFMTATMLHKEYGLTRSPWFSIGAYSVATATAISRQLNNKHWMSDVLAGAGIGILSTELGYYFADLIFKDKGILTPNLQEQPYSDMSKPSFFGLYVGFNLTPGKINIAPNLQIRTTTGSCSGFEGAWFMNRNMGFGGRLTISGNPITLDKNIYLSGHPELEGKIVTIENGSINTYSGMGGIFLSFPVTSNWLFGSKLLAGYNYWRENTLSAISSIPESTESQKEEIVKIHKAYNPSIGTGISFMYIAKPGFGVRFFCDYNYSPTRQVYDLAGLRNDTHHSTHVFMLGASVNILFLRQ